MYAGNQYDAIAEDYDSLFKDKASIEENLEQEKTEYIEMACPHCGEIIRMKK